MTPSNCLIVSSVKVRVADRSRLTGTLSDPALTLRLTFSAPAVLEHGAEVLDNCCDSEAVHSKRGRLVINLSTESNTYRASTRLLFFKLN